MAGSTQVGPILSAPAGVRLRGGGLQEVVLGHRPLLDGEDRLARLRIQHEEIAVGPHGCDCLLGLSVHRCVVENQGRGQVVLPDVVVHELLVPLVLTRVEVECHDRGREQVIAGPQLATPHRDRVSRADVEHAEVDVDARGHPDAAAAKSPDVAVDRPGLGPKLAGFWNDVEEPPPLPGAGVDRHNAPAQITVAVGHADDHQAVCVGGRGGDPLPNLPLHADQVLPDPLTGFAGRARSAVSH